MAACILLRMRIMESRGQHAALRSPACGSAALLSASTPVTVSLCVSVLSPLPQSLHLGSALAQHALISILTHIC